MTSRPVADDLIADDLIVDARGLRCPWPVLRTARAMRLHPDVPALRVIADDPIAPGEIEALAREQDWGFAVVEGEPFPTFRLTRHQHLVYPPGA